MFSKKAFITDSMSIIMPPSIMLMSPLPMGASWAFPVSLFLASIALNGLCTSIWKMPYNSNSISVWPCKSHPLPLPLPLAPPLWESRSFLFWLFWCLNNVSGGGSRIEACSLYTKVGGCNSLFMIIPFDLFALRHSHNHASHYQSNSLCICLFIL